MTAVEASAHGLGPMAARRRRALGREVPADLLRQERATRVARQLARTLLERVRPAVDGRLLLFKGPEVAVLYPGGARLYKDVDLLASDALATQEALLAAGFVELEDEEEFEGIHHLAPLGWPGLPLKLEIHERPKWPRGLPLPPLGELFDESVPATIGVDGIDAPAPRHHVLLLARHAWGHEPLRTMRDLIDVAATAEGLDLDAVAKTADAWGIGRMWRTTYAAADWLVHGGTPPLAVRLWARYLLTLREPTVAEGHVARWLSSFWLLPPGAAVVSSAGALAGDLRPVHGETWGSKLRRTGRSLKNALTPKSKYGWKA